MAIQQLHQSVKENPRSTANGLGTLPTLILLLLASVASIIFSAAYRQPAGAIAGVLFVVFFIVMLIGHFTVNPNEARVLLLFGRYAGTVRETGLRWANPFLTKKRVSLRVRNFESEKLKVNEREGNPIEIAAVVVWRVVDSAEALFHVDNFENFVHVQSEAALRNLATHYTYDAHVDGEISLRSHTSEIAEKLQAEIQERLVQAGVEVIEARITHLAYAPEIAHAMLRRQQASAVIGARAKMVDGAVGMVEMALEHLEKKKLVELDPERRAAMVSNLLVVLCSDRGSDPVVNVGTLYN